MGIFSFRDDYQVSPQSTNGSSNSSKVVQGKVKKVYLDFSISSKGTTIIPGAIEAEVASNNKSGTVVAYPENEKFLDLPLETETVDIDFAGTIPIYRRINLNKTINNGGVDTDVTSNTTPKTGIGNFKSFGGVLSVLSTIGGNFGSYFKKKPIHRLKLYEGDTIIQSKFGQSIRLSGFNNKGNDFNPRITIRNKESDKFKNVGLSTAVEEDLNLDGTTILMSSGDDSINFTPGTVDSKLKLSNFKNRVDQNKKYLYTGNDKDVAVEYYPPSYSGEQCIITSDRLVFSSRKNQMIFWSKGSQFMITDGIFTIDALNGVTINAKNNIDIQAYNKKINFYIGDAGEINVGDKNLKAAVDGPALVAILADLIAEIINLRNGGLLTPAGPTSGMNSDLEKKLRAIGKRLENVLSSSVKIQI